jgi:DNA recombination protein RmuC
MTTILVGCIGLLLGAAGLYFVLRDSEGASPPAILEVQDEIRRLAERFSSDSMMLGQRLEGIDTRMAQSQNSNASLAQGIFETLGDVRQATTAVADQARQFSSLQDLLRAPKARGGLGEAMLEEMLRQVLPASGYETQHRFSSGVIVDAVVKAGGRLVCIDSKFPLSNFQSICDANDPIERKQAERAFAGDVEKHMVDIATRYIVPDEGTFDFAVMYVPAEGVYGEVLRLKHHGKSLYETAMEHRVVPMSPLTMYGYLQTILFGLKCFQIEKNAEAILDFCGRLQQDVGSFADEYETLGRHLCNATSRYEAGARRLDRFKDGLERVADLADADPPAVPSLEAVGE